MSLSCVLALVLLMDNSGSIANKESELQRDATALALKSREIVSIIERREGIALTVIYFDFQGKTMIPWTFVQNQKDIEAFSKRLMSIDRPSSGTTNTGAAINYSIDKFESAPCGDEQVIDVSTDGTADDAENLAMARSRAMDNHIKINGLLVMAESSFGKSTDFERAVDANQMWMDEFLKTPTGFSMIINSWEDYPTAIKRKLNREMSFLEVK